MRKAFGKQITVLRILDSRRENFKLSAAYKDKVLVYNIVTAPEIEMLIIASKKMYDEYCRSGIRKPSDYCRNTLGIKRVKSPAFIKEYFSDASFLINSIKEYHRVHKQKNGEASLYDLIKAECK